MTDDRGDEAQRVEIVVARDGARLIRRDGFIATENMTVGRISRIAARRLASSAPSAEASAPRGLRRRTTAVARPAAFEPMVTKTSAGIDPAQRLARAGPAGVGVEIVQSADRSVEGAVSGGSCASTASTGWWRARRWKMARLLAGVDAELQLPGLAARGQLGDQGEEIVAIGVVAAGDEGEPALVLDHAVVVLGEAQLVERVRQRPLGRDQQRADMKLGVVARGGVGGIHTGHSPSPSPSWAQSEERTIRSPADEAQLLHLRAGEGGVHDLNQERVAAILVLAARHVPDMYGIRSAHRPCRLRGARRS